MAVVAASALAIRQKKQAQTELKKANATIANLKAEAIRRAKKILSDATASSKLVAKAALKMQSKYERRLAEAKKHSATVINKMKLKALTTRKEELNRALLIKSRALAKERGIRAFHHI